jgi:prepilin-type N-terminal cleavage/methylation domain-containing protein
MAEKSRMRNAQGFTLTELAIAMLVLLVGIVAVGKLVPAAMQSNMNSRQDITAAVVAQREIDQMVNQSLNAGSFVDSDGRTVNLGVQGGPLTTTVSGGPIIPNGAYTQVDFASAAVPGYNYFYTNLSNSGGTTYEVRWAVVVRTNSNGIVSSKRFIVGCWKRDSKNFTQPVNIDTVVSRF